MLTSTIHRLQEQGILKICEMSNHMHSYTYEYMGRVASQRLTVDVRMKKTELLNIVKRATSGSLPDMVTVAMLYNVGYGLPYDEERAKVWTAHATLVPATKPFDVSCEEAMQHAHAAPAEIYPDSLIYPCLNIIDQIHDHTHQSTLKPGMFVAPRLKGVRVYLIYRHVPGYVPHLYAGFYRDGEDVFLAIDKLIDLGFPRAFGELRDKLIINSYEPFGVNSMYVVAATIYVPESIGKGQIDAHEQLRAYLDDDTVERTRESFDVDFYIEALAEAEKTVKRHERSAKRYTDNGQQPPAQVRNELIKARRKAAEYSDVVKNANPQAEFEAYTLTRPRSKLRYVAHELYKWNRRGLFTLELCRTHRSHLQSLGFMSTNHPALECVGYIAETSDVSKTVKLFEKALDAKVEALIYHPSATASVRFADVSRIDV